MKRPDKLLLAKPGDLFYCDKCNEYASQSGAKYIWELDVDNEFGGLVCEERAMKLDKMLNETLIKFLKNI